MAHSILKLRPGVQAIETPVLNEAGVSSCQLIRYKPDSQGQGALIEKLGGWAKFWGSPLPAIIRCLWAWQDLNANKWLGAGMSTDQSGKGALYALACSTSAAGLTTAYSAKDITPVYQTTSGTASLSVTTGSASVSVTDTGASNVQGGGTVYFVEQVAIGGLILYGPYKVDASTGVNSYTFTALTKLGAPAPATSTTTVTVLPQLATTNGSALVTATLPNHGYAAGNSFPVLKSTSIGGITFSGEYEVFSVTDANTFKFYAATSATSTASGYVNSNVIELLYSLPAQPPASATGFGIGGYGLGGYGTGQPSPLPPGVYSPATDWALDNWGEDLLACPVNGVIGGVPYSPVCLWSPTAGMPIAAAIPQSPPVNDGCFVAMPQRQVVAWGSTFTGVQDPLLLRWCDIGDFTQWIGTVTNQAGSYRIPRGSKIVAAMQGPQQGLVWTDVDLWAMQYINQPYVYGFNEIGTGCGLLARKGVAALNGVVYWIGPANFYKLAGAGVEPIECPVWDVIFQNLDKANLDHIRTSANSMFSEITWYYPPAGGNGEATNYVKYNTDLDKWDYGTLARSACIDQSVLGPPIGAGPNSKYIYQHEISPDADGQPLVSWFLSGMFAVSEADQKIFIDEVWPDMKWNYSGAPAAATVQLTFYARDFPQQAPVAYGPFTLTANTTYITPRIRARLLQIGIENTDTGTWWRIGGLRYRAAPDGRY